MNRISLKARLCAAFALAAALGLPAAAAVDPAQQAAPADGWASQAGGTLGGSAATSANIYTVTNRSQLLAAITNGATNPKIIKVVGIIDMSEGVPFTTTADQSGARRHAPQEQHHPDRRWRQFGLQQWPHPVVERVADYYPQPQADQSMRRRPGLRSDRWRHRQLEFRLRRYLHQRPDHVWIDHNSFTDGRSPTTSCRSNTAIPSNAMTARSISPTRPTTSPCRTTSSASTTRTT